MHIKSSSTVPRDVVERVEALHYKNAARNVFLFEKTCEAIDILQSASIPVLPIKGAIIAHQYFGDIGLRRFDDVDLLVARDTMIDAKQCLTAHGYQAHVPLTPQQERYAARSGWEFVFTSDDEHSVEISPGIAPNYFSFEVPFDELWKERVTMDVGGHSIDIPRPEHHLLLLAAHGAKHLWKRMVWIADVARLLEKEQSLNWEALITQARSMGGFRMLSLACAVAQPYGTFHTPAALSPDKATRALAERVRMRMDDTHTRTGWRRELPFHLACRERLSDRCRYVTRLLLQPGYGDWTWLRLPNALYYLYIPLRPLRLLIQTWQRCWRRN